LTAAPIPDLTFTVSAPGCAPQTFGFALEQDTFACGCTGIKSITKTFELVPSS
jgi:hypothetical protein